MSLGLQVQRVSLDRQVQQVSLDRQVLLETRAQPDPRVLLETRARPDPRVLLEILARLVHRVRRVSKVLLGRRGRPAHKVSKAPRVVLVPSDLQVLPVRQARLDRQGIRVRPDPRAPQELTAIPCSAAAVSRITLPMALMAITTSTQPRMNFMAPKRAVCGPHLR